jgi:hypothetical protein
MGNPAKTIFDVEPAATPGRSNRPRQEATLLYGKDAAASGDQNGDFQRGLNTRLVSFRWYKAQSLAGSVLPCTYKITIPAEKIIGQRLKSGFNFSGSVFKKLSKRFKT